MSAPSNFTIKITATEIDALESLLSHDSALLIDSEGGLISEDDYRCLIALYNRAQAAPFRANAAAK